MENYFIDTHSHINMIKEISLNDIISKANESGVKKIIIPSSNESEFDEIIEICESYENVFCLLGVFPQEAKTWNENSYNNIKKHIMSSKKVVGLGEIGLDYYWDKSFAELQKEIFIKQIELANELNLPFAVHDREAHKDTFDIIKQYNKTSKVLMHCFSGSVEFARECVKAGFYLASGGVVTFKNAQKLKDVVSNIAIEQLVLETDAPYLTPVPFRGKTNQPAYIPYIAQKISELKNMDIEEIAKITSQNAERIFNI